jgi:glycosyltransferase involved in cell wall biosynthesis
MKKNILFIIDSLGAGGAEKAVLTLTSTLVNLGHKVTIISIDNIIEHDIDFDVKIHSLNFKKSRWEATYHKFGKKLNLLLKDLESNFGPFDLITSHLQKAHRLTALAKITNAYYCIHNTLSQSSLSGRSGLRLFLKRRKLKLLFDGKDIITVSAGVQNDLIHNVRINPKSIRTIYNPLDFNNIKNLSMLPNPYENESYIIHAGRLESQKRHDILLKAYAKSNIKEKLLLLGEGSLKESLEKLVSELGIDQKVIFAGFHKNPYPIIKHASAFVATSEYEGFFIALAEALVLGVPVISTNCPHGPSEILIGPLSDYLVPVGDTESIGKKIIEVLSNTEKARRAAVETPLERFEANQIARKYIGLCS